jgi:hypothetical protein
MNKNIKNVIDLDYANCNMCDVSIKIPDLDVHISSQAHLINKDRLATKLKLIDSAGLTRQSVIHGWLDSK